MSNFLTLTPLTGGDTGTAPTIFSASTDDTYSDITDPGYIADLYNNGVVKARDLFFINYDVSGAGAAFVIMQVSEADPESLVIFINGIKAGVTDPWVGDNVTHTFDAPGVFPTDIVVPAIANCSNAAACPIVSITAGLNTIDLGFTAAPGANTIINWVAYPTL